MEFDWGPHRDSSLVFPLLVFELENGPANGKGLGMIMKMEMHRDSSHFFSLSPDCGDCNENPLKVETELSALVIQQDLPVRNGCIVVSGAGTFFYYSQVAPHEILF